MLVIDNYQNNLLLFLKIFFLGHLKKKSNSGHYVFFSNIILKGVTSKNKEKLYVKLMYLISSFICYIF